MVEILIHLRIVPSIEACDYGCRVMSTAPYNPIKKSPECATPGSNGMSYTASSGAGAVAALSANRE